MSAISDAIELLRESEWADETDLIERAGTEHVNLRQAVRAMLMLVEAHTSEHTQYKYRETIAFAKDALKV